MVGGVAALGLTVVKLAERLSGQYLLVSRGCLLFGRNVLKDTPTAGSSGGLFKAEGLPATRLPLRNGSSARDRIDDLTPVDWPAVFGNDRPVEVEIGPGRGETLLAAATTRPGTNFFGIEHDTRRAETLSGVAAARGLANVRIVAGDARCIVGRLVPDASVAAYYIYFPDPWPKTRHRGRRLAAPDLAGHLLRTLVEHGRIHVLTDLAPLLAAFVAELTRAGLVCSAGAEPPAGRPTTHYERKYARAGAYYARFERAR